MMPDRNIPRTPGAIIRHKILTAMGVRQADLARAMGISKVMVNHLVNDRSRITPDLALRLGKATDTPAEYWLALQCEFDLFQAREQFEQEMENLPLLIRKVRFRDA